MISTSATGVILTTVLLNSAPVVLVGDPEEALALHQHKSISWAIRRLIEASARYPESMGCSYGQN